MLLCEHDPIALGWLALGPDREVPRQRWHTRLMPAPPPGGLGRRLAGSLRRRVYLRRVRGITDRLGSCGSGSIVHFPAVVIGHHRIELGRDVTINSGAFISVAEEAEGKRYDPRLTIGDRVTLGSGAVIACNGSVEIGDDVLTADRVFIGDTYHEYRDVTRPIARQGLADPRPVAIGSGAFLGIGCAILPGVILGEGAYVGAGAVVTRDVPSHAVVAGNPARVIRRWDGHAWVEPPVT